MEQENKKPLYKVLNEQRTQYNWVSGRHIGGTTFKSHIITEPHSIEVCKFYYQESEQKECEDNQAQANAQYTALAVNNLHHLAEALQMAVYLEDNKRAIAEIMALPYVEAEFYKPAKEALSRII